ncbi:hypothetical protein N657DRAFT_177490 [Parathielavia appendiculata]|uniref:Uncharacterized protein n=1 Tax=Parathielavia appendiculata TaxID=2587402 RepID=A0AAN6U5V1_9PEZI|nr:hypothetical protein N657DRAFT_177490 [Parathielavia appendiculata]
MGTTPSSPFLVHFSNSVLYSYGFAGHPQQKNPVSMAESDNRETRVKALIRCWQVQEKAYQNHWPSAIAELENDADKGLAATLDASFTKRKRAMEDVYTAISVTIDEHQARALCGDRLDEKRLAEKHIQAVSNYIRRFRAQYGMEDSPTAPGDVSVLDVDIISISSDSDHAPSPDDGEFGDDDLERYRGVMTRNIAQASRPTAAYRLRLAGQAKRSHDSGQDTPLVPFKKPRGAFLAGVPSRRVSSRRRTYSFAPSDSEENSTDIRTIDAVGVEGIDFIFRNPGTGHGYYIVRCSQGESVYHFKYNPFDHAKRAIKHFNLKNPRPKCHERRHDATIYGDGDLEEIIKKFGYRVVNSDGSDVDNDWVEQSNARLAEENAKEKNKAKPQTKGKQKVSTVPPVQLDPARREPVQPACSASCTAPTIGFEAVGLSTISTAPMGLVDVNADNADLAEG